jgi:hypothetical protein
LHEIGSSRGFNLGNGRRLELVAFERSTP